MAGENLGGALGQIHRLFGEGTLAGLSDARLLERYASLGDELAFQAIVRRHGPMVLGVCRGVLDDPNDADDAFQAAFLLLARKARSLWVDDSLGGWLHRVAWRIALRMDARVARRRQQERRAAELAGAPVCSGSDWDDLGTAIHQEIDRLPERLRRPIVLCYLEDMTYQQAASHLRWSEGTTRGRLARGRALLRARLSRRGVALTGVAAGAGAFPKAASAVSPTLLRATVRAARQIAMGETVAVGTVSTATTVLVKQALRGMMIAKLKIAATAAILAGALTWLATGLAASGPKAGDEPPASGSPAIVKDSQVTSGKPAEGVEDRRTIRGRVLDPDGRPFAGATLFVAYQTLSGSRFLEKGRSGPDGRFRFTVTRSEFKDCEYDPMRAIPVAAVAEGFGLGFNFEGKPDRDAADSEQTLRLVKDVPIHGRIVDLEGRPVVGARLRVDDIRAFRDEDLTSYLRSIRNGRSPESPEKYWPCPPPVATGAITTDAQGRFHLAGVGRERMVRFDLEGPGIRHWYISAVTRAPESIGGTIPVKEPYGWDFYGATFEHLSVPSRPIRGIVRERGTGRPVAGAIVSSIGQTLDRPRTDAQGRFELLGYPKSPTYSLTADPPAGQPFFSMQRKVSDTAGIGAIEVDFELIRGIAVRGRLTDRETGKPVKGDLEYYPLHTNPRATDLGEPFHHQPSSRAVTDRDGGFTVAALPGPGVVMAAAWHGRWDRYLPAKIDREELKRVAPGAADSGLDSFVPVAVGGPVSLGNYNEARLFSAPEDTARTIELDFALRSGRTITGVVVGPDGKPLAGVRYLGGTSHEFEERMSTSAGEFTVEALPPQATRTLNFFHEGKSLGLYTQIRGDQPGRLTIRLQPCGSATGRLLDDDGQPVKNRILQFHRTGLSGPGDLAAKTDEQGNFRVDGLVPGQPYQPGGLQVQEPHLRELVVAPGEVKDLGVARIKP